MMKGGHGPTKLLQDVNWGTFDHASHAPQLSLATITYVTYYSYVSNNHE